ncbi:MAG: hypothetical protein IH798_03890, partial [Gemmatimonadetes bacterium]|nr:hypothetical protein [Gemmatimonadota bacterium]
AQFYHVVTDNQYPYRVYGTQQDNSAISVPSRTNKGAIPWGDCYTVGNSESGYIAVHPENPNIVISGAVGSSAGGGGNLLHYDHETGQVRIITVWPELATGRGAIAMKYRFQWTYPVFFSPHDADVLYVAGNLVFRSTDQGSSWEAISPDLTRNDVTTMEPSGGPITKDTSGAEIYGTIFALVESPHEKGVFWAGSDDGLVHISRDGGRTWDDVTPPDIPSFTLISMIEVSPHDAATAYLAATRYKLDDTRPMLYKTSDYGKTWTDISQGIRDGDYTRVIREDPARPGLLYAGTETGVDLTTYDPAADTWAATSTSSAPTPRRYHEAVWIGREMVLWGGQDALTALGSGGRYALGDSVDDDLDGFSETRLIHIDNHFEFSNGAYFSFPSLNLVREGIKESFEIADGVTVPPGTYDIIDLGWGFNTDESARLSLSGRTRFGGFYSGHRKGGNINLNGRFGETLVVGLRLSYFDVDLDEGSFETSLIGLRTAYSFSPRVYLQSLIQYSNQTDSFSTNIRFGWLNTAGTGLFVVYNDIESVESRSNWNPVSRGFVVKFTQQFNVVR